MNYVTWDLFREKDVLLPESTEAAMALASKYCTHLEKSLVFTLQQATLVGCG